MKQFFLTIMFFLERGKRETVWACTACPVRRSAPHSVLGIDRRPGTGPSVAWYALWRAGTRGRGETPRGPDACGGRGELTV